MLINRAVPVAATRVRQVATDGPLEEALATLTRQNTVMLTGTFVTADNALRRSTSTSGSAIAAGSSLLLLLMLLLRYLLLSSEMNAVLAVEICAIAGTRGRESRAFGRRSADTAIRRVRIEGLSAVVLLLLMRLLLLWRVMRLLRLRRRDDARMQDEMRRNLPVVKMRMGRLADGTR